MPVLHRGSVVPKGLNHWLCLLSDVNVCLSGSGCLGDRDDIIVLKTSRLRGSGGVGNGRKLGRSNSLTSSACYRLKCDATKSKRPSYWQTKSCPVI